MQLLLTLDELQVLADVLELQTEQPACDPVKLPELEALLDRVIARKLQFCSDELDTLADVIGEGVRQIRARMASVEDLALKRSLESKRDILQRIADKITEACAMA